MSALLLRWLNEDVKVSEKVEVLERDASNGYIIAQVLHLQGLEPHLETYENVSSTSAKVHNMERLGQKLEALGLPFPISTRRAIMMQDRSAVLQFMLQFKAFLDQHSKKSKAKSFQAKVVALEQAPRIASNATNSTLPIRDVEERFLMSTMAKFEPKEMRFRKDIDMAVHLRKFEQSQWQAENKLNDIHRDAQAKLTATFASRHAAVRAHEQETTKFRRDLDRQHHAKWSQTQRRHLEVQRNNLRLELTFEARRQVYAEIKLSGIQHDAIAGVLDFENNMNRLGLASKSTEEPLCAISDHDADALSHLQSLEKRVEELGFRPSNNIKVMKELRKRRKAQLAAEKDRRMRRQKAVIDQSKSIEACEMEQLQSTESIDRKDSSIHMTHKDLPEETQSIMDPREIYLESKRAELEENYTRLRESGRLKREEDLKVLEELRSAARQKDQLRSWNVCSDVVDGLISVAMTQAASSDRDTFDIGSWTKQSSRQGPPSNSPLYDQSSEEMRYELDAFIQNFLSFSEVWATLPLASSVSTYDLKTDVQALAQDYANASKSLDTSWLQPSSFMILSVYTQDEDSVELARRVAAEHHVTFLQLDSVLEECIALSYDPQKIGDQVASLSDRERELGAYGSKLSILHQKNLTIPDTLVLEIIAKRIALYRQEASTCQGQDGPSNGCMLHNFPRTYEEAKVLEKAMSTDISNEQQIQVGEDESAFSAWDCVLTIGPDSELPLPDEAKDEKAFQGSDPSSVQSSSLKVLSSTNQQKLPVDELRGQKDDQGAQLEDYWSQSTRHIKLRPQGLHRDVLVETIHMCLDVYTQSSVSKLPALIECGMENTFPKELDEERKKRRKSMNVIDRIMWTKASKEIELEDDALVKLSSMLQELDTRLHAKLQEPMATIRSAVQTISALAVTAERNLERTLSGDATSFDLLLDKATMQMGNGPLKHELRERLLTKLEVSLGDAVDLHRFAGNAFVDALAQDPFPEVISAVAIVYQRLPLICFFLKDYAMQKLELLGTHLYAQITFLGDNIQASGHQVILAKKLAEDAINAATELGDDTKRGGEFTQLARDELLRILQHVATEYSLHSTEELPVHQYTLSEANVTTEEITRLLQQVTVLCRFADQLRQTVGQLYANDLQRLQQIIQEDIDTKDESIAHTMADMRAHGHSLWPLRDLEIKSLSRIAARLPRSQQEHFLTIPQLEALVHACRNWEQSHAAKALGRPAIANDVFVALVLEVAAKKKFPKRWNDAHAVAAVTLQQCSTRRGVSWRKIVWSLMCIQFAGIPSLEDILAYHDEALTLLAIKRQHQVEEQQPVHCTTIFLSFDAYKELPIWFAKNSATISDYDKLQLQELTFQLFAVTSKDDSTLATKQMDLLAMLLSWCIHPSCSFGIRRELEDFLPRYPRGFYRVFRLLHEHSTLTSQPPLQCILSLCAASDVSTTTQQMSPLATSLASNCFPSFYHDSSNDLSRFFVLQNPLEALVEP